MRFQNAIDCQTSSKAEDEARSAIGKQAEQSQTVGRFWQVPRGILPELKPTWPLLKVDPA